MIPNLFGSKRPQDKLFVYIHVPRCAGTFLLRSFAWLGNRRKIVVSQSPESKQAAWNFVCAEMERRNIERDQLELVAGHDAYFGIHEASPREPFYFTFLRDPVERYISNFRFLHDCAQNPNSEVHEFAKSALVSSGRALSLREVVDDQRLSNMMTHYLAATVESDLETSRWHRSDENELLDLASDAINRFHFIGLFEQLEEDARWICQKMEVPLKTKQVNQTQTKLNAPVEPELREEIAKLNRLDQRVYEMAKRRMQDESKS